MTPAELELYKFKGLFLRAYNSLFYRKLIGDGIDSCKGALE